MSLEQEFSDGERARLLMEQIKPYFGMVREAIIQQWEASPVRDKEGQSELRLMLKLLKDLEGNINTVIDTGKLAKIEIEGKNNLLNIFKRA